MNVSIALAPEQRRALSPQRPSRSPHEVELKLQLPLEHRAILEACDPLAALQASTQHLVTTYFDTPKAAITSAGFTLRVRSVGTRFIQTAKSLDGDIGLAGNHNEWEWDISGAAPDLSRLADVPRLASLVAEIDGALEPMFTTDVRRTIRTAELFGSCKVEVAIDVGTLMARGKVEPISELELELKAGPPGPMYHLAATLQATAPMWLSTESKATRGWHLRTGQTAAIHLATYPKLDAHADAADGFRLILGAALGHLTANIGPTLRCDPEGLHQMRIALRATRATLALFAPSLDATCVARFDRELQAVCRAFGSARDWDVFCLETLPAAMRALPTARLLDLADVAELSRTTSHQLIDALIRGPQFTATLLALASWAEQAPDDASAPAIAPTGRSLADLAPHLLGRVARKTGRRGRHVTRLSAVRLHRFRKALDRLCDDSIVLAALYPHHRGSGYRTQCVALQSILGAANDAVVAATIGNTLLVADRPDLVAPLKAFLAWNKARRTVVLRGLRSVTKGFRDTTPFWT